jgi:hypothetical protein
MQLYYESMVKQAENVCEILMNTLEVLFSWAIFEKEYFLMLFDNLMIYYLPMICFIAKLGDFVYSKMFKVESGKSINNAFNNIFLL